MFNNNTNATLTITSQAFDKIDGEWVKRNFEHRIEVDFGKYSDSEDLIAHYLLKTDYRAVQQIAEDMCAERSNEKVKYEFIDTDFRMPAHEVVDVKSFLNRIDKLSEVEVDDVAIDEMQEEYLMNN